MSKGFNDQGWNDFDSQTPTEYQNPSGYEAPPKKGLGCCFYGCATMIVLLILAGIGCFLVFRYVSREFQRYAAMYTDTAPKKLPVVDMPKEKRDEVVKRVNDFHALLKTRPAEGEPKPLTDEQRTLVLTSDELNAYFETNAKVREKFYVAINDDKIHAQVSIPLDELPGLKGRYLNGEGDVEITVDDGQPVVKLRNLKVKGMPLPPAIRKGVEDINFAARNNNTNPDVDAPALFARPLESITVKDGKMIVVIAREDAEPKAAEPGEKAAVTWGTDEGGNGHAYELVKVKKSWKDARAEAQERKHNGMNGHLVTIGSEAENAFLRDRVVVNERAWIGLSDDPTSGGKESRELAAPKHEGWAWVTGEPIEFVAWSGGEPGHGDRAPENFVDFNGLYGPKRGQWSHQANDADGGRYFVVEYEAAKPEATKSDAAKPDAAKPDDR